MKKPKITGYFSRTYNPFYSIRHYRKMQKQNAINIERIIHGKLHQLPDGFNYMPFLQIWRNSGEDYIIKPKAIFAVRFYVDKFSVEKGIKQTIKKIPFFAGLPGFQSKRYFVCYEKSWFAGIYSWDSVELAHRYAHSYAYKNMLTRSSTHEVHYDIAEISHLNIQYPFWDQDYKKILNLIQWKEI